MEEDSKERNNSAIKRPRAAASTSESFLVSRDNEIQSLLGLDLNIDNRDKIASKVLLLHTLFRSLYQLCEGVILHERRETLHFISFNLCD